MKNKSLLERLDPRTKLIAVTALASALFIVGNMPSILMTSFFLLTGFLLHPPSTRHIFKRIRSVLWFVLVILLVNVFTVSGTVIFQCFGFYATDEGLIRGSMLAARIALLVLLSSLLIATTTITEMVDGIDECLRSCRLRSERLIMVITLTINFVPHLIDIAQRIKTAQIARGADVSSTILTQLRFARSAALPLFASAFLSSEQLAYAMEARCYNPSTPRSRYGTLKMKIPDVVLLVVLFCCIVVTMLYER